MDSFSSCYFCGGALDVSLSEYPVVPREFQSPDGDDATVVLCPTCRRKLGAVVEDVVAATAEEPMTEDDDETMPGEWQSPAADGTVADGEQDDGSASDGATAVDTAETEQDGVTTADTDTAADATGDGAATADGDDESATSGSTGGDGPRMTKLEYNKVMRLLQNREFPVDRAEIRTVARSAYDIDPEEFDAVVEAAVDRGLIAERDGQFVDPE